MISDQTWPERQKKATFIIIETGLGWMGAEAELATPPISQKFEHIQVISVKYRTAGTDLPGHDE